MKYSKVYQHTDGKYYVMDGNKKFFAEHPCDTVEEAKQLAIFLTAQYHLNHAEATLKACQGFMDDKQNTSLWNRHFNSVLAIKTMAEETMEKDENFDPKDPCYWC